MVELREMVLRAVLTNPRNLETVDAELLEELMANPVFVTGL